MGRRHMEAAGLPAAHGRLGTVSSGGGGILSDVDCCCALMWRPWRAGSRAHMQLMDADPAGVEDASHGGDDMDEDPRRDSGGSRCKRKRMLLSVPLLTKQTGPICALLCPMATGAVTFRGFCQAAGLVSGSPCRLVLFLQNPLQGASDATEPGLHSVPHALPVPAYSPVFLSHRFLSLTAVPAP